ncbi:sugar transferase [Roseovarius indicus]|uniref:sugar transferase n=1 Tax=Roseovarius indicus TaxID=540747 RepID=UPI0040593EA0
MANGGVRGTRLSDIDQIRSDNDGFRYDEHAKASFLAAKRAFDIAFSLLLLAPSAAFGVVILILNPFLNPGPLFYVQPRMGKNCRAFPAIKFRTMVPDSQVRRAADDPVEHHRITTLGRFLRKSRVDELPQILNVLRGDMSLIGPRPDYFHHARHYVRVIPEYRHRHCMRPGISGLAQTNIGYANGVEDTRKKVAADLHYIQNAGFRMDAYVFMRTLQVIFARLGS